MSNSIFYALAIMELLVAFLWWCNGDKAGMIANLAMGVGLLTATILTNGRG